MNLKVNYNEVDGIGKYLIEKSDELDSNLKEILTLISSLNECWSGYDARNFISNSSAYVKNTDINVSEIRRIGAFITSIADKYRTKDIAWEKEVKKVGLRDEK